MDSNNRAGVTTFRLTDKAKSARKIVVSISSVRMKRRLSIMSASAPAGNANRKSGRLVAT